jgi:hypothetical protein
MRKSRFIAAVAACLVLAGVSSARADEAACPVAGERPMLVVQLFFGQSVKGRRPVTAKEWQAFLRDSATKLLPQGFTVYDAAGQWRDPATHRVGREQTKVIEAATEDTAAARAGIEALREAYRARFKQQSVGIVTNEGCGGF